MLHNKILYISRIAIFSAAATVLALFSFPVPPLPSFYKVNLSDSIVIIGGLVLGPLAASLIIFIRTALVLLVKGTSTFFIGNLADMLLSFSFVMPIFICKRNRTLRGTIKRVGTGIFSLCIFSLVLNYFVLVPLYSKIAALPYNEILTCNNNLLIQFLCAVLLLNLLKGILCGALALFIHRRVLKFH